MMQDIVSQAFCSEAGKAGRFLVGLALPNPLGWAEGKTMKGLKCSPDNDWEFTNPLPLCRTAAFSASA